MYGDALARWEREVWAKPLAGGSLALALVNHANSSAVVTASLSAVPTVFPKAVAAGARYQARELWREAPARVSGGGTPGHTGRGGTTSKTKQATTCRGLLPVESSFCRTPAVRT